MAIKDNIFDNQIQKDPIALSSQDFNEGFQKRKGHGISLSISLRISFHKQSVRCILINSL